jgi:hypothetical protein
MAFAVLSLSASPALAASVGFDAAEGYSPGHLLGQPVAAPQWTGDDTPKIQVTGAQSQAGGQSLLLDPGAAAGKVDNQLAFGSAPTQFSLRFFWRPSGTNGGDAAVSLTEFEGVTNAGVGPWVQFIGGGTVYQIKYLEGGFVRNIKLGMDPAIYENRWTAVEIIGDLSTHTFDFYLDGALEASGLPFRSTAAASLANSLNYLHLQASTSGASDHALDSFQIRNANAASVPTLSGWAWVVLIGLLAGSALWLTARREASATD